MKLSAAIQHMRKHIETGPFYDANINDDIWILRFILSHEGSMEKAVLAALKTMKFRHDHKINEFGDIRSKILNHEDIENSDSFTIHKQFFDYCTQKNAFIHTLPNPDRGVITYISANKINMEKMH